MNARATARPAQKLDMYIPSSITPIAINIKPISVVNFMLFITIIHSQLCKHRG
jgi:hypothetical protein